VLVNNAAFQMARESIEDIPDDEWDRTFQVNITAMFHLVKRALPHLGSRRVDHQHRLDPGGPADPVPAAVRGDEGGHPELHRQPGEDAGRAGDPREQRRPGADLDPADPRHDARRRGRGRASVTTPRSDDPGQPIEVASAYVYLASDEASYVSGANIGVTGGKPII
jgi:NAD(P)-dependent dehydrogenase (short-subunit alcohol dehydrogenase family)